ncbi:unnamed protein product [Kluyveromyces dobzhanskii CBS 2104]|uniref:pH-response regulator protein palH/RIM21 n=1 Tax=Kluyveromyces dobzhanskii CBS 2104 TaxID=1427455 RepID=A0A0A8L0T7_9SACH|nr:unnamed protein product [Kluyveromyces dobzhanskii CBS 2104]
MPGRSRWRFHFPSEEYPSCKGVKLDEGILIWNKLPNKFAFIESLVFASTCEDGSPLYSSFVELQDGCPYLPVVNYDWNNFINSDGYSGPFKYSIYSIIYSVTVNLIITVFLTVIVFINIPTKPSRKASYILKLGALLASLNLLIFVVRVLNDVAEKYTYKGYVSSLSFLNLLWADKVFAGIDLVVVFLLQISQVQIVMRFFDRIQERRMVLYFGLFLIIVTQLLWVIPTFSPVPIEDSDSDIDILPPFVYLFRIALSTCYASVICFHVLTKKSLCFRGRMIFLTLLTLVAVLLHPAFFIVDVSNLWIDDLSEIFNTTCYLAATVIVLEWTNKIHTLERKIQAASVLGRPIYEDEEQNFHFAIYALGMQNAMKTHKEQTQSYIPKSNDTLNRTLRNPMSGENASFTSDTSSQRASNAGIMAADQSTLHTQQGEYNITQFKRPETLLNKCHNILDSIVYYTDRIIVNGLAGSKTFDSFASDSERISKIHRVRKTAGLDRPDDVYLYQKASISSDSVILEGQEGTDLDVGPSAS